MFNFFQDVKEEVDTDEDLYDLQMERNESLNGTDISNDFDDLYDTIGKNVARKLRDMTDDQRIHAEKLINEIMYHGQMENLTSSTKLVIHGTEIVS